MSDAWEPVIGLEVHVQLQTRSKMFSSSACVFGAEPNTLTDPLVLGLPGALPVPNREAFRLAIRAGLALGGEIAEITHFCRKHYFYPDLPKGYQISQEDAPLIRGGFIEVPSGRRIGITRAHLEEDAGKTLHPPGADVSLIDLNRCGVPLLEIVSEPEIHDPLEAVAFLEALKLLMRHMEVSECDMEKGSLRVDVNVSLRPRGSARQGVRTEVKNLNSFKAVERALRHEIERHARILKEGGDLQRETRLWDDERGESRLMRRKEMIEDYRYLSEPDIPPLRVPRAWVEEIRSEMPEAPRERLSRYQREMGLSAYDAEIVTREPAVCRYFEAVASRCGDPKTAVNWITSHLFALKKPENRNPLPSNVPAEALGDLIRMVQAGRVTTSGARRILEAMHATGESPEVLLGRLGLERISDEAILAEIVREAMRERADAVREVRAGKTKAMGALVGFVMSRTSGRADPEVVERLIRRIMEESGR